MWLENLAAYSLQVAVLILAGTALIYAFRLKAPRVLLAFWQALLAICLLLPAVQPWPRVRRIVPSAPSAVVQSNPLPDLPENDVASLVSTAAQTRSVPFPTEKTIAMVLGAGAVLRLLWLALGLLRLRHYQNKSRRLFALPESIRDLQWRIGVSPEIFLSMDIDTPVTFGWQKPAVLFPESFTEMSESLQRPIACHELLHVERRDWLFIVVEEILRSLFWFHPAIWWALGRIHLSREQVVDREVLRVTGARGPYLESLLHIASLRGRPIAVPAPLLLRERHLVQRVALMLKESKMTRSRLIVSLVAIAAFLLWTGAFAAAWFPLTLPPAPAPPAAAPATLNPPVPAPTTASTPAPAPKPASTSVPAANPAPKAQQQEPIRVGGNVQAPKLIYRVEPVYPELAIRAQVEQVVVLEVLVDEQGNVANVRVVRGHPLLDQAAIDAVKQWRYSPTLLNGQAVRILANVEVPFGSATTSAAVSQRGVIGEVAGGIPSGVASGIIGGAPSVQSINPAVQAPKREPVRVGGSVQETKILKRVEPVYPELAKRARVEQIVVLEVTVNEEGFVSNVRVIRGHPLLDQAATDAVKQWVYSPTLLNGEPVPVVATVTVIFSLSPWLTLDADGYIRDSDGAPVFLITLRGTKGTVQINPAPQASFDLIQQTLTSLQAQGVENVRLNSQVYLFASGRLFYRVPYSSSTGVMFVRPTEIPRVIGGAAPAADPGIQPPVLDINFDRLAEMAKASGRLPQTGSGGGFMDLTFTVCINEAGQILAVQSNSFEIPEIVTALMQARVISPGRRANVAVPTAVTLSVRVPLN
ncbi:MAG: TonB family protein [Acidobacteriota bacterium]